jgi:uncharacterized membrane protein
MHPQDLTAQPDHVDETVHEVLRLEAKDRVTMSLGDHLADRVVAIAGSLFFVALHVTWFLLYIMVNLPFSPLKFDSFPFGLLTMVVSLEAIFLSLFVLMAQNRQALRDDRHAKVDLQVNMIAEREVTKVLSMLADIHRSLGLQQQPDPELERMDSATKVDDLLEAVEARREELDPAADERPSSAIDTES